MRKIGRTCLLFLVIGTLLCSCGSGYLEKNISKYISFQTDEFANLTFSVSKEYEITDESVQKAENVVLFLMRTATNEEEREVDIPVGLGDDVAFFFDLENLDTGEIFDTGNSCGAKDPYIMYVGYNSFAYSQVESGVVGAIPKDTTLYTAGSCADYSIYFMEYTYTDKQGGTTLNTGSSTSMKRYYKDDLNATFGNGFADALCLGEVNKWNTFSLQLEDSITREYKVKVLYAAKEELTIDFPMTVYPPDESWLGCTCRAHLNLVYLVDYTIPELTAELVQENLGLYTDSEDPIGDYRAEIRQILLEDEDRIEAIDDEIWTQLKTLTTIKAYPSKELKRYMKVLESEYTELYTYYYENAKTLYEEYFGEGSLDSLESFLQSMDTSYTSLSKEEILKEMAKEYVAEDLVVYVVYYRVLGAPLTDAELDALIEEAMTEAEEEEELTRKELLKKYGSEDYFEATCIRDYVFGILENSSQVIYTAE